MLDDFVLAYLFCVIFYNTYKRRRDNKQRTCSSLAKCHCMPDRMPSGELEDVMNLQDSTASTIKRITNAQTRTERQQPVINLRLIVLRHSLPRY